ncbi:nucleoside-diphosphate kinase [Devosia rhodophyticola]|uniref:Nucleoside-diphosphate kinase n=1 Tax=Devosia rhodophyticola TaxID=3026423 RepID=A0ABY7Z2P5_9HYPH|nr:nucleoside-diphosphate kinase [Devosia rhodophyticola]WDR07260.1 nucleoside-diphosphate kinase [Devosia rhodophyticola]
MTYHLPVILTSNDFAVLEAMSQQWTEPFVGAADILRRKLSAATVVFPTDIPADIVTLKSRVRFGIGPMHLDERVLVRGPAEEVYGMTMLLASPRGLALIGAAVGQTVAAVRRDGSVEQLHVEAVPYQPEQKRAPAPIQFVPRHELAKPKWVASPYGGNDDPGPSAA